MAKTDVVVSFDDEPLILVDENDHVVGHRSKAECHDGDGMLHRAFSVFLFNDRGELLLQQRSDQKRLWPMYWSNTCCSHPRRGETMEAAAQRRTKEELALEQPLRFAYKFKYQVRFSEAGSEHELCSVYVGRALQAPQYNQHEIAATRFAAAESLDQDLADPSTPYTPWLRLEWLRLRQEHWHLVSQAASSG